jgi:hypothetical protein
MRGMVWYVVVATQARHMQHLPGEHRQRVCGQYAGYRPIGALWRGGGREMFTRFPQRVSGKLADD